ncbi:MAG: aldose 1-epimerase family protein [Verrucomicrobia bacterium]|nr:aldose 1-epimerase family protein [Verrucomicrobiota bacterium]
MRNLLCLAMTLPGILNAPGAEPFRQVLTSATDGVHLEGWQVSSRELDPQSPVPWSVQKHTLHGGKQEGVDVIVVDNGKLRFTLVPTRGMGVLRVEGRGVRLGWDSPVQEVVHPHYINLQSRGGLGWLEGFNEWLVRCGLEFAGHPGKDKFINNVGDQAEMDLTLHGKIANIPASEVEVVIDRDPPHRLRVRGQVNERMFYGPKFELWTELSTEPGADSFRIDDTVTNHGADDQELQVIYHTNYGPPLLQAGARFLAAAKRVVPFNARAAEGVAHYGEYAGPTKGFIEQVYCLYPYAEADGRTMVLLENAAADRAVSLRFSVEQLPYFTLWKNTTAVEEGYVTGLEPGTGFPYNRRIERQFGRVPKLKPGASRRFTLEFALYAGKAQVSRAAAEVERIQGDRQTQVDTEPAKVE